MNLLLNSINNQSLLNFNNNDKLLSNTISEQEIYIVPEKNDDNHHKYGNIAQTDYAKRMSSACLELVGDLIHNKIPFCDLLKKAGEFRHAIAVESDTDEADKFGKLRNPASYNDRITTPLLEEYHSMLNPLLQIAEDDPYMQWDMYPKMGENYPRMGFRMGVCIDGTEVTLSKYMFYANNQAKAKNDIAHTYPENLGMALKQCEFFFKELMRFDSKNEKEFILESMAKFHWWFAQATPYFRGSAACGEMIISALHVYHFGHFIAWKSGVFVDRIALTSSCQEFTAIYPELKK